MAKQWLGSNNVPSTRKRDPQSHPIQSKGVDLRILRHHWWLKCPLFTFSILRIYKIKIPLIALLPYLNVYQTFHILSLAHDGLN